MHVNMYTYMYIYPSQYIYRYIDIYLHTHIYLYLYLYLYLYGLRPHPPGALGAHVGHLRHVGEVEVLRLVERTAALLEQVGAADELTEGLVAEVGKNLKFIDIRIILVICQGQLVWGQAASDAVNDAITVIPLV